MQIGSHNESPPQSDPSSPSVTRTASKPKQPRIKRPHLPEAAEVLREDSWGSGSGDTVDSVSPPEISPHSVPKSTDGTPSSQS